MSQLVNINLRNTSMLPIFLALMCLTSSLIYPNSHKMTRSNARKLKKQEDIYTPIAKPTTDEITIHQEWIEKRTPLTLNLADSALSLESTPAHSSLSLVNPADDASPVQSSPIVPRRTAVMDAGEIYANPKMLVGRFKLPQPPPVNMSTHPVLKRNLASSNLSAQQETILRETVTVSFSSTTRESNPKKKSMRQLIMKKFSSSKIKPMNN